MDVYARARKADKHDDFPSGYFATTDGTMLGFRIVSPTTGTGDRGGDILLEKVQEIVKSLDPARYHQEMKVGYAGDPREGIWQLQRRNHLRGTTLVPGQRLVLP